MEDARKKSLKQLELAVAERACHETEPEKLKQMAEEALRIMDKVQIEQKRRLCAVSVNQTLRTAFFFV